MGLADRLSAPTELLLGLLVAILLKHATASSDNEVILQPALPIVNHLLKLASRDGCSVTNCGKNRRCISKIGGYLCEDCSTGYEGDGQICTDVDECGSGKHDCHADANCINTEGSYLCECKIGYSGDGTNCTDVDECKITSNCPYSICVNTKGSFHCTCKFGYRLTAEERCEDVDECKEGLHTCHKHAVCRNLDGTHICQCKNFYVGTNLTCSPVPAEFRTSGKAGYWNFIKQDGKSTTNDHAVQVCNKSASPEYGARLAPLTPEVAADLMELIPTKVKPEDRNTAHIDSWIDRFRYVDGQGNSLPKVKDLIDDADKGYRYYVVAKYDNKKPRKKGKLTLKKLKKPARHIGAVACLIERNATAVPYDNTVG